MKFIHWLLKKISSQLAGYYMIIDKLTNNFGLGHDQMVGTNCDWLWQKIINCLIKKF